MKPILFNTEMVQAIQDGRKTVTRRLVKDKDIINRWDCESDGTPIAYIDQLTGDSYPPTAPCRYQPGDILYVRETFGVTAYRTPGGMAGKYAYKADGEQCKKWRPSIHMPKEAARIFLRVTDVRVERLQDIFKDPPGPTNQIVREGCAYGCDFIALWQNTTKKADIALYGWEANPWVWVIGFEKINRGEATNDRV